MPAENYTTVTHADFVVGMQNKTIGFKCLLGEPFELLTVPQKKIFSVLVILYQVAPFVFVPVWAYHERNWWLLCGILTSRLGVFLAARAAVEGPRSASGGWLPIIGIGLCIVEGIHSTETFYTLCALWSWMFFLMADGLQDVFAKQNLIKSSEVFDRAVEHGKIMIVRNDEKNTQK